MFYATAVSNWPCDRTSLCPRHRHVRALLVESATTGRTTCRFGGLSCLRVGENLIIALQTASNEATEELNNPNKRVKRVKRVTFAMRHFRRYCVRIQRCASRPNWDLLNTVTAGWKPKRI